MLKKGFDSSLFFEERGRWPKEYRILHRSDYTRCYDDGRRFHTEHFIIFIRRGRDSCSASARMGMAVSRKVGNAVVRNRIKRILREVFRRILPSLPHDCSVVVVAKKHAGSAGLTFATVAEQCFPLFQRLQ